MRLLSADLTSAQDTNITTGSDRLRIGMARTSQGADPNGHLPTTHLDAT
jgi:hypothetical protein